MIDGNDFLCYNKKTIENTAVCLFSKVLYAQ